MLPIAEIYVAAVISSGVSALTCHPACAPLNDHVTLMEMAGSVEINQACVDMSRLQANELVRELLPKYEDNLGRDCPGTR